MNKWIRICAIQYSPTLCPSKACLPDIYFPRTPRGRADTRLQLPSLDWPREIVPILRTNTKSGPDKPMSYFCDPQSLISINLQRKTSKIPPPQKKVWSQEWECRLLRESVVWKQGGEWVLPLFIERATFQPTGQGSADGKHHIPRLWWAGIIQASLQWPVNQLKRDDPHFSWVQGHNFLESTKGGKISGQKNRLTWIRGREIAFHCGFWAGDGQLAGSPEGVSCLRMMFLLEILWRGSPLLLATTLFSTAQGSRPAKLPPPHHSVLYSSWGMF